MPGHVRDKGRRRDGSTKWEARWRNPLNQRDRHERTFRRKDAAVRWLADMDSSTHAGTFIDPRRADRPLSRVADEWRESWTDLEPKTRAGYDHILRLHVLPKFGDWKVGAVQADAIQRWVNDLAATRAPNTVRRIYGVLRSVLRFAAERRYIGLNPCEAVKLPKKSAGGRRDYTFLTDGEIRALADAIDPHYRLLVLTAAYTGLRAGELGALRLRRLDLFGGTLHVAEALKEVNSSSAPAEHKGLIFGPTKTHAERVVSLPRFLRDEFEQHVARPLPGGNRPDSLVFTTPRGAPVRHNLFYKRVFKPAVYAALPAAKHGLRFHDLRHTCAALLVAAGRHPLEIKQRMGHASITMTMDVYGHLFPSAEAALADVLDASCRAAEDGGSRVVALRD